MGTAEGRELHGRDRRVPSQRRHDTETHGDASRRREHRRGRGDAAEVEVVLGQPDLAEPEVLDLSGDGGQVRGRRGGRDLDPDARAYVSRSRVSTQRAKPSGTLGPLTLYMPVTVPPAASTALASLVTVLPMASL